MSVELAFLGATGTVTGSKYLVRAGAKTLLVDCGLFQGLKALRLRNWAPPPVAPKDVDAVVLTHAHLDHSGYLPRFIRQGFAGPVHASPGTRDLCGILLPDSGHLQEEEARYANKRGFSKHKPALPLYTEDDAPASLKRFVPVRFGKEAEVAGEFRLTLKPAGHILGAAIATLQAVVLPGFEWLTVKGFVIGLVKSFLYGALIGVVYVPIYNALQRRFGT